MTLQEKLKEARTNIGHDLLSVSKLAKIRYSRLCWFESGIRIPKFSELSKLADIYRIDVLELLSDKPSRREKIVWSNKNRAINQ